MLRKEFAKFVGSREKTNTRGGQPIHSHVKSRRSPQPKPIVSGTATEQQSMTGQKKTVEQTWREFFSDPLQWWDHRADKINPRYPDFKHKKTQEALWVDSRLRPPWVKAELAALAPGTLQLNIFSWNTRLEKCIKAVQYEKALEVFQQMQDEGMKPDTFTFVRLLNACAGLQALDLGKGFHTQIIEVGWESDVFVGTTLVDMYAKCGSIEDARKVFNKIHKRNVVSWNTIIKGYVKCGEAQVALDLIREMEREKVAPDCFTFVATLNACGQVGALEEGRRLHDMIIETGCEADVFVGSSLVDMYAKCGSITDAWKVFDKMPVRDVVSWNSMIQAYVKCGQGHKALDLTQQMQSEGIELDSFTFVAMLNACASEAALERGRAIHKQIIKAGCRFDSFVNSSLVDMYAKCGSIEEAGKVFNSMSTHDVVSWNAMIQGHAKCGLGYEAIELGWQMQQEGVKPDSLTFLALVNACASVTALEEGRKLHEQIIRKGYHHVLIVGNSLIDMYAKCGSIEEAYGVFTQMPTHDVISWNAIILGQGKCGHGHKALELCQQMQLEGIEPDSVTFMAMLSACASISALDEGRRIHEQIIHHQCDSNVSVGNSLIDMYAKCGSIEDAWRVFNKMTTQDVVAWNAMLSGLAMHGHAEEALRLFHRMCQEGVEVTKVSFVSLLSACSHGGLVDEGLEYFDSMTFTHNISPVMDHYACLVDLLGRSGHLHKAEDLIKTMSFEANSSVWMALLSACKGHGNMNLGESIAKQVIELDPENSGGYVLLSNIYGSASSKQVGNEILEDDV